MNWESLRIILPKELFSAFGEAMNKFEINTHNRAAHFLSQCHHESAGFKRFEENLNYGTIGLMNVFPKYFPDKAMADTYARNPEKIANRVYGGRMGNGDETSGDGWRFRGRGAIQITGKNNYADFGKAINEDIVSNPDLLKSPNYLALSAAWYFSSSGLNKWADKGTDENIIKEITRRINGGYHGITDRIKLFKEVYDKLNGNAQ